MKQFLFAATLAVLPMAGFCFDQAEVDAKVKADLAAKIEGSAVIVEAIKAQNAKNAGMDQAAIDAADKAWRAETKADAKPTIDAILATPASGELKAMVDGSDGFYTEIFVMDNKGLNVAQSGQTSDLWQGDEDKFSRSFGAGDNGYFTDEVQFDESSKSFSTQVSAAVKDPATGKAIGAVTFGVSAK
ncbi:MAG: hypothetical protein H6922_00825 [Pseudomonadaceae bacterium]|nr:hypothetical protein [Pseudomonadaceae bacterium]